MVDDKLPPTCVRERDPLATLLHATGHDEVFSALNGDDLVQTDRYLVIAVDPAHDRLVAIQPHQRRDLCARHAGLDAVRDCEATTVHKNEEWRRIVTVMFLDVRRKCPGCYVIRNHCLVLARLMVVRTASLGSNPLPNVPPIYK